MIRVIDQLSNVIELTSQPQKIICLVPSITELLFDLGLKNRIVGRTSYCILPEGLVEKVPKVGGTKTVKISKIQELEPDLIIANKEENVEEVVNELQSKFNVYVSDVNSLDDAYKMIEDVAALSDKIDEGENLIHSIKSAFRSLPKQQEKLRTAYMIWRKPYMVAAKNTFIDSMLQYSGFENCFEELSRYPVIELVELHDAQPDIIFLSSEPYSFSERHIKEFIEACPTARIYIVDGQMFSWYGSRLKHFPAYVEQLISNIKN